MTPSDQSIQVFDEVFLSADTGGGGVERTNSEPLHVAGNTIVISARLVNSVGLDMSNKLVLLLEGTYDDKAWMSLYSSNKVEFSADVPSSTASSTLTGISFSSVRLRATVNGASTKAVFSAWIAFSNQ